MLCEFWDLRATLNGLWVMLQNAVLCRKDLCVGVRKMIRVVCFYQNGVWLSPNNVISENNSQKTTVYNASTVCAYSFFGVVYIQRRKECRRPIKWIIKSSNC